MAGTVKGNRRWELLGQGVSRPCLAKLLGCRPQRFETAGQFDRRFKCFGAATQLWFEFCLFFATETNMLEAPVVTTSFARTET